MKKIILHSFIYASCFVLITSCSKSVKAPKPKTSAATTQTLGTQTQTQTQTQNQQGHTCGGDGSSAPYHSGGSY